MTEIRRLLTEWATWRASLGYGELDATWAIQRCERELEAVLLAAKEDYCTTCGNLLSKHYQPCLASPDVANVLDLLIRLVAEDKKPAAVRVLARYLREHPDDGQRVTQSRAKYICTNCEYARHSQCTHLGCYCRDEWHDLNAEQGS